VTFHVKRHEGEATPAGDSLIRTPPDLSVAFIEFRRICRLNGLALSEEQMELLNRYVSALLEWNTKINLISRANQGEIWLAHILHSISPWLFVELGLGLRVLDLGSGGGLPGIPLAILRPDLSVVLLDSIRKKTDAVRHIVDQLGLKNVDVVVGRAEDVGRDSAHRGRYDIVVARAVARLPELIRWSGPFLNSAGRGFPENRASGLFTEPEPVTGQRQHRLRIAGPALLALKGGDLSAEVREAGLLGARVDVIPLVFPGSEEIGLEEKKLVVATHR
jgi:16S rRNA (guanine(527)-N(7))-methyltransferase RsmG